MIYRDRIEAGEVLAGALMKWRGTNPLVVAIPRGAVPLGKIVAARLDGELDLVLVRKLHAPGNPEFAIGAVDETGWTYLADYAAQTGATSEYIAREVESETDTIRRRRALFTPGRAPVDAAGRVVIVVDDGRHDDRGIARDAGARAATAGVRGAGRLGARGGDGASLCRRGRLPGHAGVLSRGRPVLSRLHAGQRRGGRRAAASGARGGRGRRAWELNRRIAPAIASR